MSEQRVNTGIPKLLKLEIENFQSIDHTTIDFLANGGDGTGVFWISGKSNVGKSAILKALACLFRNCSNLHYKENIRDGESSFRVTGYFEGGDVVTLNRGKPDYYEWVINGVTGRVDKTSGKVPQELTKYFKLYWTGDKVGRHLNMTLVGDPLLFVENTPRDNTLILEKAIGTDRLTRVGKKADQEKRALKPRLKHSKVMLEEEESRVEQLEEEQEEMADTLHRLDRLNQALIIEMGTLDSLTYAAEITEEMTEVGAELLGLLRVIKDIDVEEADKLLDLLKVIEHETEVLAEFIRVESEYENTKVSLTEEDLTRANTETKVYEMISRAIELESLVVRVEEEIAKNTITLDFTELDQLVKELALLEEQGRLVDTKNVLEQKLSECVVLDIEQAEEAIQTLRTLDKLHSVLLEMENIEEEVTKIEQEAERLKQEEQEVMQEMGVCPVCKQSINLDTCGK